MGRAVQLRQVYDGDMLRRVARDSSDSVHTGRALFVAVIHAGERRTAAGVLGGVSQLRNGGWATHRDT